MRAGTVIFLTLAAFSAGDAARAQDAAGPGQTPDTPPSVTVTGCLQASGTHDGFVLVGRQRVPRTVTDGGGSAVTDTAPPTPVFDTPPADPDPSLQPGSQGTTGDGSVSSADTPVRTGVTVYRLEGGTGVHLRAHAGHTVEIRGTLSALPKGAEPCCAGVQDPTARPHEPEAKQPNAEAIGTSGDADGPDGRESTPPASLVLTATEVRHIAASCER